MSNTLDAIQRVRERIDGLVDRVAANIVRSEETPVSDRELQTMQLVAYQTCGAVLEVIMGELEPPPVTPMRTERVLRVVR